MPEVHGKKEVERGRKARSRQSWGKYFKEEAEACDSVTIPGDTSGVICSQGSRFALARMPILVCSGCYNKIPETGWLINSRNLFLRVLETGSPRSWRQQMWCLVLFAVTSHGRGGEGALWGLFNEGTNPNAPLKGHVLMPSRWVLGFNYMNFWLTQTFSPQQDFLLFKWSFP